MANVKTAVDMKKAERFVSIFSSQRFLIESKTMCQFAVLKLNVISKAKGSAYIEMGNTKVIVSVFDPREIVNKQSTNR